MSPSALPMGTVIRLTGPEKYAGYLLRRTEGGWCSRDSTPPDLGVILATRESWEVVAVPADWLAVRLTLLEANATTDVPDEILDAIREVALDAGLS